VKEEREGDEEEVGVRVVIVDRLVKGGADVNHLVCKVVDEVAR